MEDFKDMRQRALAGESRKPNPEYRPRVIVKFLEKFTDLPYTDDVGDYLQQQQIIPWGSLREKYPGIRIRTLFTSVSPGQIRELVGLAKKSDPTYTPPNFLTYFRVDVPAGGNPDELARVFLSFWAVETAYTDPPIEAPSPAVNFVNNPRSGSQGYLDAAGRGIDAKYAWSLGGGDWGGDGNNQVFIDLEQGWTFDHDDLPTKGRLGSDNLLYGDNIEAERPHGTRVLGVVCGVDNTTGIVGIAPHVRSVKSVSLVKDGEVDRSNAIMFAINSLRPLPSGAVMLLEAEVGGLNLPLDVLKDTRENIRLATALGITVVEAAGNKGIDLGSYTDTERNAAGTLITIHPLNPNLSQEFRDSGAIMVAAGTSGYPHSRCPLSNYGKRIDCYAWGENVYTCDSQPSNSSPSVYTTNGYTDRFDGTSSAAAIIAGAALVVQGFAETHLGSRFDPQKMRSLLSDKKTSTPSGAPPSEPIGVMPNLKALLDTFIAG